MSQNYKHGGGYGLDAPGQFYKNPQTITESGGPNWRESYIGARGVQPGVMLGTDDTVVAAPDALLSGETKGDLQDPRWIFRGYGRPEAELELTTLTQFRGQGDPPPLPDDPAAWRDEDWSQYFSWVSSDKNAWNALVHTWREWDRRRNTM